MDNEKTKEASRELDDCFEELPFQENNRVVALVGSLCAEHERVAFFCRTPIGSTVDA